MLWLLALVACGGGSDEGCRPGFARGPDGHCYPPPPDYPDPVVTDALDNLPDCVPLKPTGEVDLVGGCAGPACAGDTFAAIDEALPGDGPDCTEASWSDDWAYCVWGGVLEGLFELDAGEPIATGRTDWIHLLPAYAGATDEGLGTLTAPRCWTDALDLPERIVWVDVGGTLQLQEMVWERYGLYVYDWEAADGAYADGTMDHVYLFGAP